MIDEVIPIDLSKMENINELHKAMCEAAKAEGITLWINPFPTF